MKKYFYIIAPALFFAFLSCFGNEVSGISDFFRNAGRISGILGFLFIGLSIFIGTSSRFLDKYFGLEKILRFHRIFMFVSVAILFLHPFLLSVSNVLEGDYFAFAEYLWEYQFTFGVLAFIFFVFVVVSSYYFFKKINFTIWIIFHRLTIVFYFLSFIHITYFAVLTSSYLYAKIIIYFGVCIFLLGVIIRIFLFFIKRKIKSVVVENIKETGDTYSLKVKKPENFSFNAGQFCFISFNVKGMRKPHPFTISSSPQDEFLQFTIKSLGKFTSRIKDIKIGETIIIDGPYGVFTYKRKNSVFIAGGVGITPFKSFISSFKEKEANFTLLFGNKTKDDILFKKELDSARGGKVIHVLSSEKIDGYESGFISKDIILKYCDLSEDFYLCGPPILVKNTTAILTEL
ncbi:MAG TPA: FAD-binding oxidoreductase, partial [Spirochaetota bacterium]|nr:FAD-binding oxidoreductase [Spirochaetota bacterium]